MNHVVLINRSLLIDCQGGDRADDSKCEGCEDWNSFEEDDTVILLLKGYRQFCKYFLKSEQCTSVLESRHLDESAFDGNRTLTLLMEGAAQYKPDVKVHVASDATRPSGRLGGDKSNRKAKVDSIPKDLIFGGSVEDEGLGTYESEEDFELECDDDDNADNDGDELLQEDPLSFGEDIAGKLEGIKAERVDQEDSEESGELKKSKEMKVIKVEDESSSGCGAEMVNEDLSNLVRMHF